MIRFAVKNASTPPTNNPCTTSATMVLLNVMANIFSNMMANILSHEDLGQRQRSDENALDLIQADGIVGAIIELGRARGFVVSYLLRMLNCTTVLQIGGDASCTKSMAAPSIWTKLGVSMGNLL